VDTTPPLGSRTTIAVDASTSGTLTEPERPARHLYGFSRFSSTTAAVYFDDGFGLKSYTQNTFV
jgi:hypothetical protein